MKHDCIFRASNTKWQLWRIAAYYVHLKLVAIEYASIVILPSAGLPQGTCLYGNASADFYLRMQLSIRINEVTALFMDLLGYL